MGQGHWASVAVLQISLRTIRGLTRGCCIITDVCRRPGPACLRAGSGRGQLFSRYYRGLRRVRPAREGGLRRVFASIVSPRRGPIFGTRLARAVAIKPRWRAGCGPKRVPW